MSKYSTKSELAKELAEKLPQIRAAYGISQTRLGQLLGKSRQHVSKIERGITPLSWDTCLAVIMLASKKDEDVFVRTMGKEYLSALRKFMKSEF